MTTHDAIIRVTYRYDDQAGADAGWYCESYDPDGFHDDSQKIWFPVAVDDFSRDQEAELVAALTEAFPPGCDIVPAR